MTRWLGFAGLVILLSGCSATGEYLGYKFGLTGEAHVVPPGIKIFNMSKADVGPDLRLWGFIIEKGFAGFKKCVGEENFPESGLIGAPIILLPSEKLVVFGSEIAAFTDLSSIFIRSDSFNTYNLWHEWTHVYLWLVGRRFLGDIFHKDELFAKTRGCAAEVGI